MNNLIPILSLVVAVLAVFFGPFISVRIARQQITASLEVANKQITAPMRQAWINSLRDLLAELASSSLYYYVAGYEDRTEQEYQRLTFLEQKISLMLNASEEDHQKLEKLIREMITILGSGIDRAGEFPPRHKALIELSRRILKREWNVVKDPIELESGRPFSTK